MIFARVAAAILLLAMGLAMLSQPAPASSVEVDQAAATGLSLVIIRSERRADVRRVAVVSEPWFYCAPSTAELYVVPAGYVTDFASVPGWVAPFFPPFGDWAEASVIHDWLYDIGHPDARARADRIFRDAVAEQTDGGLSPTLMYWGVRAGGVSAYRRAGERRPSDWKEHFVDRQGRVLETPPLPQPIDPVWRTRFDCASLNDPAEIARLRREYEAEQGVDLELR